MVKAGLSMLTALQEVPENGCGLFQPHRFANGETEAWEERVS